MRSLSSTTEESRAASPLSKKPIMGNQGFMRVLLRSTAGELYKIRRRALSKILLLISTGIIVVVFSVIALIVFLMGSRQTHPSVAKLSGLALPLHLPASLTVVVSVMNMVGVPLIIILAGTVVGGEYGGGTIRVLLVRGLTRTQYLLAKVFAILVCIPISMVILIPIGIAVGACYNLSTHIAVDFTFLTRDWIFHAIIYILLAVLNLFIYAMLALSLATLGKSTAAGVAGGIVVSFLEGLLGSTLTGVGLTHPGIIGNILKAIPDYFVGTNINALLVEQSNFITNGGNTSTLTAGNTSTIPDWRAWLVIAVYLVVFLRAAWWVSQRRDITN